MSYRYCAKTGAFVTHLHFSWRAEQITNVYLWSETRGEQSSSCVGWWTDLGFSFVMSSSMSLKIMQMKQSDHNVFINVTRSSIPRAVYFSFQGDKITQHVNELRST